MSNEGIDTNPFDAPQAFETLVQGPYNYPQMTPADIQGELANLSDGQFKLQSTLGHFMEATEKNLLSHRRVLAGVKPNASASLVKPSTSVRVKEPRVFDGCPAELEPFLHSFTPPSISNAQASRRRTIKRSSTCCPISRHPVVPPVVLRC